MRVALLTGVPFGGSGAAIPAIAAAPGVELVCVILARSAPQPRSDRLARLARKIRRVGPLGALNGLRLRGWFHHHGGRDVRATAAEHHIPLVEVETVNSRSAVDALEEHGVELGVSIGNGYIRASTFQAPRYGIINYHGELLPEYPGGQSIIWPIHFGRSRTGFTIHRIDKGIDTGAILLRREFDIAFRPSLRETVEATGALIHPHMPGAIAEVLSHWSAVAAAARTNAPAQSFTTPTILQFARMVRNNRRLYRQSRKLAALAESRARPGRPLP